MSRPGEPELLTPAEVAALLRVTRRTVYQWITDGRLPALRAGGRWRIRREDIEAFLHRRSPEQKGGST